jgi:hypothetical protein
MRIRTIKPEILTDEKSAALSDTEWRLFVSCIVMADDYGNFRASPAFLHSQVFWSTATTREDSKKALETLARLSLLMLYDVGGQQYGHVVGWAKHQRVDHPGKPLCPRENQGNSIPCDESSRDSRDTIANPREALKPDRDLDQEGNGKGPSASPSTGRIRPRNANDLEHCLRVAVQASQKIIWSPGDSFHAKEARVFLEGFGADLEAALPTIEARIELFAKDKAMSPWTVEKFAKLFNGIGQAKPESRQPFPVQRQAVYPKLPRAAS